MNLAESFLRELIERRGPIPAVGLDLENRVVIGFIANDQGICKFIPHLVGIKRYENINEAVDCANNISKSSGAIFVWAEPYENVGPMALAILKSVYKAIDMQDEERKWLESVMILSALEQLG